MTTASILVPATLAAAVTKRLLRLSSKCGVELHFPQGTTLLFRRDENGKIDTTRAIDCARITVGELPSTNGYTFVGKLLHTSAGNIIALVPSEQGTETPETWRTCKATCDHCNTTRRRSETFIVRCPDGAIKRVGSNCLADFLARDATSFLALSAFQDAIRESNEGDWNEPSFGGEWLPTTAHYLACAVSLISTVGFFKRGSDVQCTADAAASLAGRCPVDGQAARAWRAAQPTAEHTARAAEVLAWISGNDDRGDYMHNLRVASAQIVADRKMHGILASAPQAFNRAQGVLAERKARAAAPDAGHLGTVGDRLDLQVTIMGVKAFDSQWGSKRAISMRSDAGHEVITFTTGEGCGANDTGKTFMVRGTVKRHSTYRDKAQTELSRCAFTAV